MRVSFPAYQGAEPYLFVCYSHSDSDVVYPELVWLKETGLHIWYDEGISPGTVWREELAQAIEASTLLLFFISPASVQSNNCMREISFAVDQDLNILSVYLEPTKLPRGLRLAILDRQALLRYQLPQDEYQRKLLGAVKRIVERPDGQSKDEVAVRSRSFGEDRIHVGIATGSRRAPDPLERDLANAITRYVSWQGGIFRAHDLSSELIIPQERIDYRVAVSAQTHADEVQASWQVLHAERGEIVWANRIAEPSAQFAKAFPRIAEMISEGVLKVVTDHELHRMAGHSTGELSYAQLVLRAEQLNYLDREQVVERLEGLKRAIELEPGTASAHACLAQLLSWQIINGVSDDAARDESTLLEEAKLALKLSPNDPYVLLAVGTTYCRLHHYDKGLGLIRRSVSLAPTVLAKDQLARSLCFAGQPENAVPLFEEILETMPAGHTFPYVRLAIPLIQLGRLTDALKYSGEGVIHFPEDYYSWVVHANLLAQLGHKDQAVRAFQEARRLLPKLRLQLVIDGTEATYGRTPEQRNWLTAGLRSLLDDAPED